MDKTTVVYGIPNCDTVKKARRWLDTHGIDYEFHDYKKSGIDRATLSLWCEELGWESLLNKRGTTWRKLPEESKNNLTQKRSIALMIENTSLIKRPVLKHENNLLLGFDEGIWTETCAIK